MAKQPVTRHWYRVALAREGKRPELVAASGEHMGHAIAEAQHAIDHAWPVAVEAATGGEIPLGESVGKGHVVRLGDAPVPAGFRWPVGVLPAIGAADKLAAARAGWVARPAKDLLVIEAQPPGDQVIDHFMTLIERLPAADNLEVRVLDHFEDAATTDVWLTSRVNAKQILRFMDDHDEELIGNGHVELSVYVRKHKATLRLTEHKTIVWLAEDAALEREVETWLTELHIPRARELVTVRDAAHFHYRPAKSRDRKKLGEELYRQRLRKVATVKSQRERSGTV